MLVEIFVKTGHDLENGLISMIVTNIKDYYNWRISLVETLT